MSNPKYLYHYTDADSIKKIASSGQLRPSLARTGDAALGSGVYFTSKPPNSSNATLMNNNYDSAASSVSARKVQSYVRVDADKVNAVSGKGYLGRDVYVVPTDRPLDLHNRGATGGYRKRY